jgi:hypothetical protein
VETAETHLVVVDGFLREDLSTKTGLGDVVAIDLFNAVEDARYNKIVRKYLARNASYHDNGLDGAEHSIHSGRCVSLDSEER